MGDMTTEYFWECSSVGFWQTKVQSSSNPLVEYTVTKDRRGVWHCTCKKGQFTRHGVDSACLHVDEAKGEFCGWSALVEPEQVREKSGKHFCPRCGEEAVSQGYAV